MNVYFLNILEDIFFWLALWAVLFARVYFGNISACVTHNLATPLEFAVALGDHLKQRGLGCTHLNLNFCPNFILMRLGTFQGYSIELMPN
jgi:hypothetical protein